MLQLCTHRRTGHDTVSGANVMATVCNLSVSLYQSSSTSPSGDVVLLIGSGDAIVSASEPLDSSDWIFDGMMQVGEAAPGIYPIADECGLLSFDFATAPPLGLTCTGTGPNCAPGCGAICSESFGCTACSPQSVLSDYSASGVSDCLDDSSGAVNGSWTVTLTDVEPFDDAGTNLNGPRFIVHGSVTGTLRSQDGGTDTATLSLAF